MIKKYENFKLGYDIIWGLIVIGIASLYLRDTVYAFFGMIHITYWDALDVIFLICSIKLLLKEVK